MKNILVFGDSQVSGMELNDRNLYDDFPGMRSWEKIDEYEPITSKWFQESLERRKFFKYQDITHQEHSLAFPAAIQRSLGIQVLNLGIAGASQQRIHLSMMDTVLASLKSGTNPHDLRVVFSLTGVHRYIHRSGGITRNVIMGSNSKLENDPDTILLDNIAVECWTDEFLHTVYMGHVMASVSFLKARGIQFHIVDGRTVHALKEYLSNPACPQMVIDGWNTILMLAEMSSLDDIVSMREMAIEHKVQNAMAPGSHFGSEVHDLVASELVSRIKKSSKPRISNIAKK